MTRLIGRRRRRLVLNIDCKTVSDAGNGYHSVPLRQSDRHLTPGSLRSDDGDTRIKAPQGFVSLSDGYNRRFDAILSDVVRNVWMTPSDTDADALVENHALTDHSRRNSISRGELLTSQGSAYLTKPSSPCQIHGRMHPRLSDSQLIWPFFC